MKFSIPLVLLALFAGCASPAPRPAAPAPIAAKKPDKHVILDPALNGILRIVAVQTNIGSDRILKFQVDVQNLTPAVRTITYQIDWLNRKGISLGLVYDDLHWLLLPREQASLSMTAPTPLATDFRLSFHPRHPAPSPIPP